MTDPSALEAVTDPALVTAWAAAWAGSSVRIVWDDERPNRFVLQGLHPESGRIAQAEVALECEKDWERLRFALLAVAEMQRAGPNPP